jgi:very-short-patch-repair endonuclease
MTEPELRLWLTIRNGGLSGLRFRRQALLGPYIVDFLCLSERLILEVDGGQLLR